MRANVMPRGGAPDLGEAETRDIALRYLGRREYAVEELRRKLLARGADPAVTDRVVSGLAADKLVSDRRFTEMYVRTRRRALFGPLKIRAELRGRGVDDRLVAEAMPADDQSWAEAALQWCGRRCREELDYAGRARLYRSLLNRGFTHEQANAALAGLGDRNSAD